MCTRRCPCALRMHVSVSIWLGSTGVARANAPFPAWQNRTDAESTGLLGYGSKATETGGSPDSLKLPCPIMSHYPQVAS